MWASGAAESAASRRISRQPRASNQKALRTKNKCNEREERHPDGSLRMNEPDPNPISVHNGSEEEEEEEIEGISSISS